MTEAVVWIAGGIGLSIVLRAAALYRGADRLAFGLVALIGAGLVLGVLELVQRARKAKGLSAEIGALPPDPTEESVDAASPTLRTALRARIAGSPSAAAPPPYASYLLGLLVMFGLLGTFLGLFESLRGAREALGSSGDVAALRAALGAPMAGLARAFGTSATGVSASAMLGLALVAVRRYEAQVNGELATYVAGPLSSITVARRTLDALEAIARQGASLPVASEAMTRGAAALSDVAREVGAALEKTTSAIGDDLRGVAQTMRSELKGAGDASARALADAVGPRLDGAVSRVMETTARQADATIARIDAATEARMSREAEQAKALQKALESAFSSLSAAQKAESAAVRETLAREAKGVLEAMLAARREAAEAEATRAEAFTAKMDDASAAFSARLTDTATTIGASLREVASEVGSALGRTSTKLGESLEAQRAEAAQADLERVRRLEASIAEITARLADDAKTSDARSTELLERLDGVAKGIETTFRETASHVDASFARTAERLDSTFAVTASRVEVAASSTVEQLGASTKATLDQLSGSVQATVDQLATSVTATVGQLSSSVTSTVEQLSAAVTKTSEQLSATTEGTSDKLASSQAAIVEQLSSAQKATMDALATSAQSTSAQLADYLQRLSAIREELRADDDARAERMIAETDERLAKLAAAVGEALSTSLDKVIASAQAAPEAAARVIDESAARLRAQADSDKTRDEALLEVIGRLEGLASALEHGAKEQQERVGALEARLAETYENTASKWTESLAAQQQTLVDHSDKTVLAVREASEALNKGGEELASLSDLFGTSVDRYREASDKWLTGLSQMRAVAERAAQVDAQDLLAAYLEQTREVFDQTLAFQRQLFAELRKTRTEDAEIVSSSPRLLSTTVDAAGEAED
jgi:hypothetical protein